MEDQEGQAAMEDQEVTVDQGVQEEIEAECTEDLHHMVALV